MKIGVLFGTFNPIHNGHIDICENIKKLVDLDKVFIVPSINSPHKGELEIEKSHHRYNMCRLACEEIDNIEVSDIEIKSKGYISKIEVLDRISRLNNSSEIYYVMGSDVFISLPKWEHYEEIISNAVICVIPRNEEELEQSLEVEKSLISKGGTFKNCSFDMMPISSTDIRDKIKKGYDVSQLISKKVLEYIKLNKLYIKN